MAWCWVVSVFTKKVLWKTVNPPQPPQALTPPLSTPTPITPFHQVTSSPPDALTLQSASTVLNQMLESGMPLTTPARIFVRRVTNTAQQFQAELTIIRTQYQELRTVVSARAERKTGKRKSLQGHVVVSQPEFVEEFAKLEQAAKDCKKKQGKKTKVRIK